MKMVIPKFDQLSSRSKFVLRLDIQTEEMIAFGTHCWGFNVSKGKRDTEVQKEELEIVYCIPHEMSINSGVMNGV